MWLFTWVHLHFKGSDVFPCVFTEIFSIQGKTYLSTTTVDVCHGKGPLAVVTIEYHRHKPSIVYSLLTEFPVSIPGKTLPGALC